MSDAKSLRVQIPAGVTTGKQIRLKGQGQPGMGGRENGDLYLEVTIEDDRRLAIDGRNVTLALPVAPWEAMLGAIVAVPTLGGLVKLNIPPDARGGQKLRLKGKGLPGNPPGDQFVVLKIVMPRIKTEADRELIEQMKSQMAFDPRSEVEIS